MDYKKILKSLVPPIVLDAYRILNKKNYVHFSGTYKDWPSASKESKGYDSSVILEQAIVKTRLVVSNKATYERDGVVFNDYSYPYQLLTILLRAATENNNNLTVLDFGGALGSSYFQCRSFLQGLNSLKWCVIEQDHFVEAGNRNFANEALSFYTSISACSKNYQPNLVLFSGVLQYLPSPYAVLDEAISCGPDYIVIDRNPFRLKGDTVLSLQNVPARIVDSSYPVWLFNENEIKQAFLGKYSEVATFDALDGTIGYGQFKTNFKGVIYKKITEKVMFK